jgi:hypothetical protein
LPKNANAIINKQLWKRQRPAIIIAKILASIMERNSTPWVVTNQVSVNASRPVDVIQRLFCKTTISLTTLWSLRLPRPNLTWWQTSKATQTQFLRSLCSIAAG